MTKKKAAKASKARGIRKLPSKTLTAKQARDVKGGRKIGDIKGESLGIIRR